MARTGFWPQNVPVVPAFAGCPLVAPWPGEMPFLRKRTSQNMGDDAYSRCKPHGRNNGQDKQTIQRPSSLKPSAGSESATCLSLGALFHRRQIGNAAPNNSRKVFDTMGLQYVARPLPWVERRYRTGQLGVREQGRELGTWEIRAESSVCIARTLRACEAVGPHIT